MVFAPFMALEPSDWIAIVAIGAGALMGVLGRRVVAIVGGIILVLGLGGLAFSLYHRGDENQDLGCLAAVKGRARSVKRPLMALHNLR